MRAFTAALVALAIAASPALACKGDEIFSDDFANDEGPWDNGTWIKIGGGHAELQVQAGHRGVARFLGAMPKEFDVCVDITYPDAKDPEGGPIGGIAFWFKEYANMYVAATVPAGAVGAFRMNNDKFLLATPFRKRDSIKAGTGATNTLRVTVKGNSVTVYANDQRVASFRGVPDESYIGLFAESERDQSNPWKFSNFKLTEPPK